MPHPYYIIRKSIYASINGRKGGFHILKKCRSLKRDEKEKVQEIIDKIEELRVLFKENGKPYSDNFKDKVI